MNQIICENEAVLLCTRQQDGVCILRCRTADPILRLPETVGGLPVVALGDYLCAAREPDVSQYDVFKVRLTTGERFRLRLHTPAPSSGCCSAQRTPLAAMPSTTATICGGDRACGVRRSGTVRL